VKERIIQENEAKKAGVGQGSGPRRFTKVMFSSLFLADIHCS
jgi:hypothetical protein